MTRQGPFRKFVEIGRVCLINYGPNRGKLVVIVDVVDENRAFIDAPAVKVPRQIISFKRLSLTPIVIPNFPRGARQKTVTKKWAAANVCEQWEKSSYAKKTAARAARAATNDFERFQVMVAKRKRGAIVAKALGAQAKAAAKA